MSTASRGTRAGRRGASKTFVIDAFPDGAFRHLDSDAIVCVDVMESGTTLVTAVVQGRRAFVAASAAEASAIAARLERPLLAGPSATPPFEVVDGPAALASSGLDPARPLVLFSPPGTELLLNAAGADTVMVACFRNLTATAEHAARRFRHVSILAAGCRDEVSSEDLMAAARIAAELEKRGFQAADLRTSDLTRRWSPIEPALAGWGNSAARLRAQGRTEDLDLILGQFDDVATACECRGGEVGSTARLGREAGHAERIEEDLQPGPLAVPGSTESPRS